MEGAERDVFPYAQEVYVGGVLKGLPRLHHRAEGADLLAVDEPRVVLATRGGFHPLHPRCPLLEPGLDPARVQVRRFDDVRIGRDEPERRHCAPPIDSRAAAGGAPAPPRPAARTTPERSVGAPPPAPR